MNKPLQHFVDEKGTKSSVLVPLDAWEDINIKYNKLLKKVKILTGIQKGLLEVEESRKSGIPLKALNDFLNESGNKSY